MVQFNSKIFRKLKVTYIVRKVNKVKEKFLHQHLINTCEMMIFRSVKHHIKKCQSNWISPSGRCSTFLQEAMESVLLSMCNVCYAKSILRFSNLS